MSCYTCKLIATYRLRAVEHPECKYFPYCQVSIHLLNSHRIPQTGTIFAVLFLLLHKIFTTWAVISSQIDESIRSEHEIFYAILRSSRFVSSPTIPSTQIRTLTWLSSDKSNVLTRPIQIWFSCGNASLVKHNASTMACQLSELSETQQHNSIFRIESGKRKRTLNSNTKT